MANLPVVTPNPIPTFKQPIADGENNTTRPWYFFFQSLYNNILKPTGVTPGSYTNTNLTVNANGVITAASSGTGGGVTQIVAGSNITISPPGGTGIVTVNAAGSSVALPGTIPDLLFWWESDDILGTANAIITRLRERTPWIGGLAASASGAGSAVFIDPTLQNSLPVLKWPAGVVQGYYAIPGPVNSASPQNASGFTFNNGATYFLVAKGTSSATTQAILGGLQSSLSLYLVSVAGTAKIGLVKAGIAVIGSSSTTWTPGTFFQANATYNSTTGAFAFRQGRASAGSGTGSTAAGTLGLSTNLLGGDVSNSNFLNGASLALLLAYNRILTPTEITNVENYILAKWGV